MYVIICGGRNYVFNCADRRWLDTLGVMKVYTGGAPGADSSAEWWSKTRGIHTIVTRADWATYGKAAGPIRNQEQLDKLLVAGLADGVPMAVVAFPGGKGTADMVRRAKGAGVQVIERRLRNAD